MSLLSELTIERRHFRENGERYSEDEVGLRVTVNDGKGIARVHMTASQLLTTVFRAAYGCGVFQEYAGGPPTLSFGRAVYRDPECTDEHTQPIVPSRDGTWPPIYLAPGSRLSVAQSQA